MLDNELNRLILKFAPKHSISDIAPNSFETLMDSKTTGLVVWSGASEGTIYGSSLVNYAFRAWHDSLHISLCAGFDLIGESRVANEQARLLQGDGYAAIILGEVLGQTQYYLKNGFFPTNQVEFMANYLKGKGFK
jgi:hypothetical protein